MLASGPPVLDHDSVVEVPLLLPGWQFQLLETAASDNGLTTAQMVRRLISQFCGRQRPTGLGTFED